MVCASASRCTTPRLVERVEPEAPYVIETKSGRVLASTSMVAVEGLLGRGRARREELVRQGRVL